MNQEDQSFLPTIQPLAHATIQKSNNNLGFTDPLRSGHTKSEYKSDAQAKHNLSYQHLKGTHTFTSNQPITKNKMKTLPKMQSEKVHKPIGSDKLTQKIEEKKEGNE